MTPQHLSPRNISVFRPLYYHVQLRPGVRGEAQSGLFKESSELKQLVPVRRTPQERDLRGWGSGKRVQGRLGSGPVEGAGDDLADLAGHGVADQEEEDGEQGQHQHRRQMRKRKVFSGFTNQLKEVFGRLRGERGERGALELRGSPWAAPARAPPPVPPPHLGLPKRSGSCRPFPTGRFSASSAVGSSNSASTFP